MSNEFYKLDIQCVPPYVVPQGPSASPEYQSCLIQGSRPGQTVVRGSDYILSNYTYTRDHLWRNFGIVIAFFVLFVAVTMAGTEYQTSSHGSTHGGAAVTVFMRGQVPSSVKEDMKGVKNGGDDMEKGEKQHPSVAEGSEHNTDERGVEGIERNAAVFTWQDVNYTIPYHGGQRKLLQDVNGYVKPGRVTALMGASGSGFVCLP